MHSYCRPGVVGKATVAFVNAALVATLLLRHVGLAEIGTAAAFQDVIRAALRTMQDAGLVIAHCEGTAHIEAMEMLRSATNFWLLDAITDSHLVTYN